MVAQRNKYGKLRGVCLNKRINYQCFLLWFFVLTFWFLLTPGAANAADFRKGEIVTVSQPVDDDIYITGKNLNVRAKITGDFTGFGRSVIINDTVNGDIVAACEQMELNGYCSDDIRFAGRSLKISGNVKGDIIAFGKEITIDKNVVIEGDLIVYGESVNLEGIVRGKITISCENADIDAKVGEEMVIKAASLNLAGEFRGPSTISSNEFLADNSRTKFYKNVKYWSEEGKMDFTGMLENGAVASFDPSLEIKDDHWKDHGMHILWFGAGILMSFLLCLVLFNYFFSSSFSYAGSILTNNFAKSLGWGTLYFVFMPALIFIMAVIVIGIPVAVLLFFVYLLSILFSPVISALVLANYIKIKGNLNWGFWKVTMLSLLLLIMMNAALLIPFIGFLLLIILILSSSGALILKLLIYNRKSRRVTVNQ
jgi:cytoskeletal protein CcmA (bactofilin family)